MRHFQKVSNLDRPASRFINPPDPWQGGGSRSKRAHPTRGADGRTKREANERRLEQSNAAADAIARERQTRKAYAEWFAAMNPEERAAAHALGVRGHLPTGSRPPSRDSDPDIEFLDPSTLPASCVSANPIDALEPQRISVELEKLSDEEIAATSGTFSDALTWALNGDGLVALGQRLCVMVHALHPDLARGLQRFEDLSRSFAARVQGDHHACGVVFGRALEWASRGASISQLGERLYLVAYVLRPALIDARTLASLGSMRNKSRQAKDKAVQCLRDTFAGLQARTMRGEITRLRCKQAASERLNPAPSNGNFDTFIKDQLSVIAAATNFPEPSRAA